jgi:hypothetical protein
MKKLTLIALLFALNWQANAQISEAPDFKRNELKLDVAHLLNATIKIEYEHFLNDWSSLGVVALQNFSSKDNEDYIQTQLLGLYRLYFGKNPMSGFFLEGSFGLTSGNWYNYNYLGGGGKYEKYTTFGMGIALGWKWHIPKSNVVLDLFGGAGRLFGDNNPGFAPRVGICVGKRF